MKLRKKLIARLIRWLYLLLLSLFVLFILVIGALQFPYVQSIVAGKVVQMISERTGTEVAIDRIGIRWSGAIHMRGFYVEDHQADTLAYVGDLRLDINLPALRKNTIHVRKIRIRDATLNMIRHHEDTLFNYDHLIRSATTPGNMFHENNRVEFADSQSLNHVKLDQNLLSEKHADTFAVNATDPEPEASPAWNFKAGSLCLQNIRFRFADHFNGTDISLRLGNFTTTVDTLDISGNAYYLGDTHFNQVLVSILMSEGTRPSPPDDKPPSVPPDVGISRLLTENIVVKYHDKNGFSLRTKVAMLDLKSHTTDLEKMHFGLEKLRVKDLEAGLPEQDYVISVLDADNLWYAPDSLSLVLRELRDGSLDGFLVRYFSADIAIGKETRIESLSLETEESMIKGNMFTSIPLLQFETPIATHHSLVLDVHAGRIGPDLQFWWEEAGMLFPEKDAPAIDFLLHAYGQLDDLILDTLHVDIPGSFSLSTAGKLKDPLEMRKFYLSLPEIYMYGYTPRIMEYIPGDTGLDPDNFPEIVSLKASFSGQPHHFETDAILDMEGLNLAGRFHYEEVKDKETLWKGHLSMFANDPLSFAGTEEIVKDVRAQIDFTGEGFDYTNMVLSLDVLIDSMWFNHYHYKGLEMHLNTSGGLAGMFMEYSDQHLIFNLKGEAEYAIEDPTVGVDMSLDHVNLKELGFTDDLIAIQTRFSANLRFKDPAFPDGVIGLYDTSLLLDREVYSLDTLQVTSTTNRDAYALDIYSPIVNGRYRGNISPVDVPAVLSDHFYGYFEETEPAAKPDSTFKAFTLSLGVNPSPYISRVLFPQLTSYESFSIETGFDNESRLLLVDAFIPDVVLSGWHIKDLQVQVDSDRRQMDVKVGLPSLDNHNLVLKNIAANGIIRDNILSFDFGFDDRDARSWLGVSGMIEQTADYTMIRLEPELVINRQRWTVPGDNEVRFLKDNVLSRNMQLSSDDKEIAIVSTYFDQTDSPLELHMKQIDLGLFDLIGGEAIVEGIFEGSVVLWDIFSTPVFTSDLHIERLGFQGHIIGDASVIVNMAEPGLFDVEAGLRGYGNRLDISGFYRQGDPDHMDMILRIDNLELAALEAMTFEQLSDMEGNISGSLRAVGDPSGPDFQGSLVFDGVAFHVAFLHTKYSIPGETILFDKGRIYFSDFSLLDRSDRAATLDGTLSIQDLSDIRFDLSLTSDNFLLFDIPRGANDLFFGRLLIDTRLRMFGDLQRPVIDGGFKLNQGSSFSVIPPQVAPEAIGDEGVVEFISIYDDIFADLLLRPEEPDPMMSVFNNLDLSVNVEIDPQTEVRILIDEMAGDILEVRGGGLISYGVAPGARISLAGRYEISQGTYQMTFYDVIRRNFQIERGSNIIWTGDPLDARVDITAKYTVRTSVRELMASHAPAGGQQETAFRQIYPFDVFLKMKGELMQPEISFEIALPPEHRGAMEGRLNARLNELNETESELNKQVFALLIIGNFIQDDPLAAVTGGGPGISATARSSASRLLSDQLNRLSDRYIRGIDISFDLESYEQYENGQMIGRTELQMEISRDFLDQRLRITAGGHIELEDETRRQINPADLAGDFTLEYLLDQAGRFTLKVFRERRFQDVFENELIETGLSITFRQTFNTFRELFMRKEEEVIIPPEETDDP
ncbi:MAG: translocation/assembly module TamB [Bacteroidia bacterium]|nr:MAG: translocation/assembly module TamB [Bacteroidia bacterium]